MPALPSGQHVAVDPAPLNKLLLESDSPFNAHHLMALEQADDLLRWLDLLLLKPAESLTPDERASAQPVAGAPAEFVGVPVGRLADWRALAGDWPDADRAAFAGFIDERVRPAMLRQLANVRAVQARLRKSPTLAGAFAAMWHQGCHPLQDERD